jgi:hypothetical protein
MSLTYRQALALSEVELPAHLVADAEVPILAGAQAQGDLLVVPWADAPDDPAESLRLANRRAGFWTARDPHPVPDHGVRVVGGVAANAHVLHRGFDSPGILYAPVSASRYYRELGIGELAVGCVIVPAGESALLVHTDEHGANGIAPGAYLISRKRELGLSRVDLVDD